MIGKIPLWLLTVLMASHVTHVMAGQPKKAEDGATPLENGFEIASYSAPNYPGHHATGSNLFYKDPVGKRTRIWPYLLIIWGNNTVIRSNMIVAVAGKADTYGDGQERLTKRLIGFEAPAGPPMDITDQVLQKFCLENGVQRTNIIKDSFVSITKTNDAIAIDFVVLKYDTRGSGTSEAGDGRAVVSWDDIKAIMQDVRNNGKTKKEKWSGFEYLQEEIKD